MSDTENIANSVDGDDAEESGDVIRPLTADTDAIGDVEDAANEDTGESRPVTAGESNYGEGDTAVDESEKAADTVERPFSARSESSKPGSARPTSSRPSSAMANAAKPSSARPVSGRPASGRPTSGRPTSGRPPSARPPSATTAVPGGEEPTAEVERNEADDTDSSKAADDAAALDPTKAAGEGADEGAGEDAYEAADKRTEEENQGSSQGHHPDVITDIEQSPEARAEVDEMAQQQAREVIRSRQSSAGSERRAPGAEEDRRRASGSNASVRSAPPSRQAGPAESIANMAMQPPSPSKIKTGPWLSGTYRLPKSGKIISGEELCEALERMTNAYIDKYLGEKNVGLTKEISPGTATAFNTKKLSQDEYDAMIARLYKPKERGVPDSDRIQLITLKFGEDGQEQWVPVKTVNVEEQKAYMCELYQRCLDNRKKTNEELAAKYLKPLGLPRRK